MIPSLDWTVTNTALSLTSYQIAQEVVTEKTDADNRRLLCEMENDAKGHERLVMKLVKLLREYGSTAILDMTNLLHRQPCKVMQLLNDEDQDEES